MVGHHLPDVVCILLAIHETNQCNGGGRMTNSDDMRWWYVPLEIVMLRRWLVAAFIMNVLLLTVDYLRAESDLLLLGVILLPSIQALRASLPNVNDHVRRNISLVLSAITSRYCCLSIPTHRSNHLQHLDPLLESHSIWFDTLLAIRPTCDRLDLEETLGFSD